MPLRPAVGNHEPPSPPRQHQHPQHPTQQQQQRERHAHTLHTQQRAHAPAQPAPDTQAAACTASRWGSTGTRGTDGSGGGGGGGVGGGGSPVPHGAPALRPGAEERRSPSALGGPMEEPTGNTVVIRIGIPDLQQTKCMKFNVDAPIWLSKQQILCTLNQSLKDVLNYGLFQPAYNGKAGKFLDEERPLREYPFPSIAPVPYLE